MRVPFKSDDHVLELGGGERASFHPNLDIRQMPGVDIVADLNERLPIDDNTFDGVYSSYLVEHVSWRKIRHLLGEIFRVLKPGGSTFLITANLFEQAKRLADTKEWTDSDVCMIFGDQNYSGDDWRANSHCCGFSPEFAIRLMKESGFEDVAIMPHPSCKTDMLIEARKPKMELNLEKHRSASVDHEHEASHWTPEQRKEAYDYHYFDGGDKVGGYANMGYMDYYVHWCTYNHIMDRKPSSVLELGCARGYILKRLEDQGIKVKGLEISSHCHQTRVISDVVTWDITQTPWPIEDKEFDLCFSNATLEHIPEQYLPAVISEIERTCKRGLHGIDLGEHDDGFDKTHCTLRSLEWWKERMPESQECVDKESLERGVGAPGSDGKIKLNIGSFTTMFHYGWLNIDIEPLEDFARSNGFLFKRMDVRNEDWGIQNNTVDMIFSSHFLEHLSYEDGKKFLKRCYEVMKPGGLIRILIPSAWRISWAFVNHNIKEMFGQLGRYEGATDAEMLFGLLFKGHAAAYDLDTLRNAMIDAGFKRVSPMRFRESESNQMRSETMDMFPDLSLIMEATK